MKTHKNPLSLSTSHTVDVFETPGEFMAWLDRHAPAASKSAVHGSFYSGETWADVCRKAVSGDADTAKRADALMSRIEGATPDTVKRVRRKSPAGRVSVGAYLSSDPMPCRVQRKELTATAPLSIVVSLNSLAKVSAGDLERRGVAIAALVKKLSRSRPVTLYLSRASTAINTTSGMLVKFPTTPLDSYRLAYLLSSQGFCRGAGFAFHCAKLGKQTADIFFAGNRDYSQTRFCEYQRDLEKMLGHEVFYIPGSDPSNPDFRAMTKDPVAWLNETCQALTGAI